MKLNITVVLFFISTMGLLAAGCSDGGGSSGGGAGASGGAGGGGGGAGGQGGGMGGTGGTGGAGGAGGAGGQSAMCHGDQAAWATIKMASLACQKNSDCCVVVNSCLNEAQIVASKDSAAAQAAWPYCENQCTDCIPPAVVVECGPNNTCVGYNIPPEQDPPPELSQNHCGIDQPPVMMMGPDVSFGCGN